MLGAKHPGRMVLSGTLIVGIIALAACRRHERDLRPLLDPLRGHILAETIAAEWLGSLTSRLRPASSITRFSSLPPRLFSAWEIPYLLTIGSKPESVNPMIQVLIWIRVDMTGDSRIISYYETTRDPTVFDMTNESIMQLGLGPGSLSGLPDASRASPRANVAHDISHVPNPIRGTWITSIPVLPNHPVPLGILTPPGAKPLAPPGQLALHLGEVGIEAISFPSDDSIRAHYFPVSAPVGLCEMLATTLVGCGAEAGTQVAYHNGVEGSVAKLEATHRWQRNERILVSAFSIEIDLTTIGTGPLDPKEPVDPWLHTARSARGKLGVYHRESEDKPSDGSYGLSFTQVTEQLDRNLRGAAPRTTPLPARCLGRWVALTKHTEATRLDLWEGGVDRLSIVGGDFNLNVKGGPQGGVVSHKVSLDRQEHAILFVGTTRVHPDYLRDSRNSERLAPKEQIYAIDVRTRPGDDTSLRMSIHNALAPEYLLTDWILVREEDADVVATARALVAEKNRIVADALSRGAWNRSRGVWNSDVEEAIQRLDLQYDAARNRIISRPWLEEADL